MIRVLCRSQIKTRLPINTVSFFRWHLLKASRTFWNQSDWVIGQSMLGTVPSKKWKKKDENITTKGNTLVTYKCIYQHMITYKYPITLFFFALGHKRARAIRRGYKWSSLWRHRSITYFAQLLLQYGKKRKVHFKVMLWFSEVKGFFDGNWYLT